VPVEVDLMTYEQNKFVCPTFERRAITFLQGSNIKLC